MLSAVFFVEVWYGHDDAFRWPWLWRLHSVFSAKRLGTVDAQGDDLTTELWMIPLHQVDLSWFNMIFNPGNLCLIFLVCLFVDFFPISKVLHDCLVGVSQHQRLSFHASINSWNFPLSPIVLRVVLTGRRFHHVLGQAMMAMVKRNWGGGFGGFGGLFGSMFGQMNQMMEALGPVGSRAVSPFGGGVDCICSILPVKDFMVICCEVVWWWWIWPLKWSNAVVQNGVSNIQWGLWRYLCNAMCCLNIQHYYIILPWSSLFVPVFSAFILQVRKWTRWWWTHISRVPNEAAFAEGMYWYCRKSFEKDTQTQENLSIWQRPPFLDQICALKNNRVHKKQNRSSTDQCLMLFGKFF